MKLNKVSELEGVLEISKINGDNFSKSQKE